jgi:hypothetical protein
MTTNNPKCLINNNLTLNNFDLPNLNAKVRHHLLLLNVNAL